MSTLEYHDPHNMHYKGVKPWPLGYLKVVPSNGIIVELRQGAGDATVLSPSLVSLSAMTWTRSLLS